MSIAGDSTTVYPREFQLGDWRVRPTLHRLELDGQATQIEPRSMDVLVDLARHAGERGLVFLSSPFSFRAVELLEKIGMPAWKVASGEISSCFSM